ncbi:MAG TPA: acetolactate synthase small subunit [Desulfomicrobiaceae bacterium]|nr:acetolactate synthase small subunit [Desulfomicrobiaceae bacterium]
MRHILSILVENEPGVLSRVVGLFSGRGFNIESLNVAPTLEENVSHMTISTSGDDRIIEQIIKQLRKLITVIKVVDLTEMESVDREMVLVKISAEGTKRAEILRIADIFRCKVVDVGMSELTLEITGDRGKVRPIITLLQRFGIKEFARTGPVSMRRSMQLEDLV